MKRPVVELSDCIFCQICADVCPAVFIVNDAGYIEVRDRSEYPVDAVNEAVKNCPAGCIYWEEG